jgi:hypothetical protein
MEEFGMTMNLVVNGGRKQRRFNLNFLNSDEIIIESPQLPSPIVHP